MEQLARGAVDARAAGRWLTITPISVTPSVAPIERENCVSAVAEPIVSSGTAFWTRRTKTCIISPSPMPAIDHVPRDLAVRRVATSIRQTSSSPDGEHDEPDHASGL